MKTFLYTLLSFLTLSTPAIAEKMVDLGEYEIEGQIRKPSIQWIETQKKIQQSIQIVFESQLEKLEKELLSSEPIQLGAKNHE